MKFLTDFRRRRRAVLDSAKIFIIFKDDPGSGHHCNKLVESDSQRFTANYARDQKLVHRFNTDNSGQHEMMIMIRLKINDLANETMTKRLIQIG